MGFAALEVLLAPRQLLPSTALAQPPRIERWTDDHARAFARFTHCFTHCLVAHVRKEEEVLFPALEDFLPRDLGPLAVLRGEHQDLHAHFARLRQAGEALAQGSAQPLHMEQFVQAGRAVIQALRDHFYKEERLLFPMVARFLSAERDVYLLGRMNEISSANTIPASAEPRH